MEFQGISEANEPPEWFCSDAAALDEAVNDLLPESSPCLVAFFAINRMVAHSRQLDSELAASMHVLANDLVGSALGEQFQRDCWLCVERADRLIGVRKVLFSSYLMISAPDPKSLLVACGEVRARLLLLQEAYAAILMPFRSPVYAWMCFSSSGQLEPIFND